MKKFSFKGLLTRRNAFAALTVLIIAVLLVGNVALAYLGQEKMLFADITPEGLYTLSDRMKEECAFVDDLAGEDEIEIIFCNDPDYLIDSSVTRIPYFMSLALQEEFDNVSVTEENIILDPTSVARYKTTSLSEIKPTDIIVSYGGSYRIVNAESFWTTDNSGAYWSYNGEYKMATLIKSLTAVERPVAYFVINHEETYYNPKDPEMMAEVASFYDLLIERGLEVKTLDLSREFVPDDCVLLIINNPRIDFTYKEEDLDSLYKYTETDKLDMYLSRDEGAIIFTKDYSLTLPNIEQFMHEWGMDFSTSKVSDKTTEGGALSGINSNGDVSTDLVGQYITDSESHAYAIYGDFAKITSAPRFIIPNTGYITCSYNEATSIQENGSHYALRYYSPFFTTTHTARAHFSESELDKGEGIKDIAAIATRTFTNSVTAENTYAYMFAANSAEFLSSRVLGNPSYANYEIMSALVQNISRIDEYASIDLGGVSQNSTSFGGKQLASTALSELNVTVYSADAKTVKKVNRGISAAEKVTYSVIAFSLPVAALAVGIVIRIKRKFL